jgi:hypothetical protein
VDWANLLSRVQYYKTEEQAAVEHWQQVRDHECNLDKVPA